MGSERDILFQIIPQAKDFARVHPEGVRSTDIPLCPQGIGEDVSRVLFLVGMGSLFELPFRIKCKRGSKPTLRMVEGLIGLAIK